MACSDCSRRSLATVLVIVFLPACAGLPHRPTAGGAEEPALAPETLQALAAHLERDAWRPNTGWTPEAEREPVRNLPAVAPLRWTFGGTTSVTDALAALDSSTAEAPADSPPESEPSSPEAAASSSPPWDGIGPNGLGELLDAVDTPARPQRGDHRYLAALMLRDDVVGWNAAILWAQRDPSGAAATAAVLERLVTNPPRLDSKQREQTADEPDGRTAKLRPISAAMQNAAAEVWCRVLAVQTADPLDGLAPAARLLERPDLSDSLRGELFRGVARWAPPAVVPRLANAFPEVDGDGSRSVPADIRRAAIEACLIHALRVCPKRGTGTLHLVATRRSTHNSREPVPLFGQTLWNRPTDDPSEKRSFDPSLWPATIGNCRFDPDGRVRRTYGRWLAAAAAPEAFSILKAQLLDTDSRVRDDALASLGVLGGDETRGELQRQARRPESRVREFAVRGLAHFGPQELAPYVNDSTFNVRMAVAEGLGRHATVESALLLRELLTDSDPQVQAAAVKAIDGWPDPLGVPLLLHGMRDGALVTRQRCFARLRERTGVEEPFPFDAPRPKRHEAITHLVRRADLPSGYLDQLRLDGLRNAPAVDELHAAEIETALQELAEHPPQSPVHQAALERLWQLGPADVPQIERLLRDPQQPAAAVVRRDVLPRLSPIYAALLDLESSDVFVRRRGAQALAQLGAGSSLSAMAAGRLWDRLAQEQDRLVWRYAMTAVSQDATEEAARVAELACNHSWPDIRLLGCEYAARHGRPPHALWLLPLLHDPDKGVRLAAVEAAGRCRNPVILDGLAGGPDEQPLRGLRPLLTAADPRLQLAAAASMSRLGDPQAMQELVRQSFHASAAVRERVVREMGESGQTRFIEHLVRQAWTEPNDGVKRGLLDSLNRLVPPERRPAGLEAESSLDARIRLWSAWWDARQ